jgi:hypothetical protein
VGCFVIRLTPWKARLDLWHDETLADPEMHAAPEIRSIGRPYSSTAAPLRISVYRHLLQPVICCLIHFR